MHGVRPFLSSRLMRAAIALMCAAGASACASSQSPIDVQEFETLKTGTSGSTSTCTSSGAGESSGLIDSSRTPCCGFAVGVQMKNFLTTTQDYASPPLETDTHTAIIQTLTASYKFIPSPGGSPVTIPTATFPVNAIIPSGGVTTFVSPLLANATGLANQEGTLVVNVAYSGVLQDGTAIAAGALQFPIDVCAGCSPVVCASGDSVGSCTPQSSDQPDGTVCIAPPM